MSRRNGTTELATATIPTTSTLISIPRPTLLSLLLAIRKDEAAVGGAGREVVVPQQSVRGALGLSQVDRGAMFM